MCVCDAEMTITSCLLRSAEVVVIPSVSSSLQHWTSSGTLTASFVPCVIHLWYILAQFLSHTRHTPTVLTAMFYINLVCHMSLYYLSPLAPKRTFGGNWHRLLQPFSDSIPLLQLIYRSFASQRQLSVVVHAYRLYQLYTSSFQD